MGAQLPVVSANSFLPAAWIEQLAAALEHLAEQRKTERADISFPTQTDFNPALDLLRSHPLLRPALAGVEESDGFDVVVPTGTLPIDLRRLVSNLAKLTVETSGKNAANTLHRFLHLGKREKLEAVEITLFYGLRLAERLDLGHDLLLAPYDSIEADYGLRDDPERAILVPLPPLPHEGDSVTALVRGITWGPAVVHPSTNIDWWSNGDTLPEEHATILNLLSMVIRRPLATRGRWIRAAEWLQGIDSHFQSLFWSGGGHPTDGSWSEGELSDGEAKDFQGIVREWRDYHGNRETLALAIRRLALSQSRTGRDGMEDAVLDSSIALEIMYELDGSEISFRLATRAGALLGTAAESRVEIFQQVREFYKARSMLVHDGRASKDSLNALAQAREAGADIALRTLRELLRRGRPPLWDKLVMGQSDSQSASSIPA